MAKHTQLYQLTPDKNLLMQCNVIRTRNDKVIVIDGGHILEEYCYYIHAAIRAILGLKENEFFEVEAWILTHDHEDHLGELCLQLEKYTNESNFVIHNFYFDFADLETAGYPQVEKDAMRPYHVRFEQALAHYAQVRGIPVKSGSYYQDLNGAVVNAKAIKKGLTIAVDNVELQFLQTRDEADDIINSSSLVFKMTARDENGDVENTVMFLGDTSKGSGERLLKNVDNSLLRSDIVQMAHHGNWACDKTVYDAIGAKMHVWPTPLWVWDWTNPQYDIPTVREWVGAKTTADENNLVACLYEYYPENRTSVSDWKKALPYMCLNIPLSRKT